MSIGGGRNAGLLAVRILGSSDAALRQRIVEFQAALEDVVLQKDAALRDRLLGQSAAIGRLAPKGKVTGE